MKKGLMFSLILGIFLVGFVIAANNSNNSAQDNADAMKNQIEATKQARENATEFGEQMREQIKARVREGNFSIEGKKIMIKEMNQVRIRIHSGNFSADTDLNISEDFEGNKSKLQVKMNNGKYSEIKVMPDVASETALTRLRLKVCNESNNCMMMLKEVGKDGKEITNETKLKQGEGNESRLAYEMQVQKKSRFLGIFSTKMQVKTQIDAENGEVLRVNKPWWAFMASESDEIEDLE